MPIYEVRHDSLAPVNATSFETERLSERGDIQRLLKDRIDCLEEGLMVLAEEFSNQQASNQQLQFQNSPSLLAQPDPLIFNPILPKESLPQ